MSDAERLITDVTFSDTHLITSFDDGRRIETPLIWFPRLNNAAPEQRANWRLAGAGYGVHRPEAGEDVSAEGLREGLKSFEYRSEAKLCGPPWRLTET